MQRRAKEKRTSNRRVWDSLNEGEKERRSRQRVWAKCFREKKNADNLRHEVQPVPDLVMQSEPTPKSVTPPKPGNRLLQVNKGHCNNLFAQYIEHYSV